MKPYTFLLAVAVASFVIHTHSEGAEPAPAPPGKVVRVVVWDEQQPQQKAAYDNFLGNAIAEHLKSRPGFAVRSVKLDDPGQGLSDAVLDDCDVLVWWGHVRHKEVTPETAKRVVARVKAGKLGLVALHSAHWSQPFVQAMYERTIDDARKSAPDATLKLVDPPAGAPKKDDPLTPSVERKGRELVVKLPMCVFPSWRADGQPSHVTTLLPDHPIAAGLPKQWEVPQTEMYDEPFHVPPPDEVVFEEKWDKGEHFRTGCIWTVGKGKVFYFRPGHETYPVYRQELPLHVIENACRWMGGAK